MKLVLKNQSDKLIKAIKTMTSIENVKVQIKKDKKLAIIISSLKF